MRNLEQLTVNRPSPYANKPWHPETLAAFDVLQAIDLPEPRVAGEEWRATGFEIAGSAQFLREILKERFYQNPAVGYTFAGEDGTVVEFERLPNA